MQKREAIIRQWFNMWLRQEDLGIMKIFAQDVIYIESWGPCYEGAAQVKHWFDEWNTRGKVTKWEIKQFFHKKDQTVVEWYFANEMNDGCKEIFDGVSIIKWTTDDKIAYLQEFGCNIDRYNPYAAGDIPNFKNEKANWF